MSVDVVSRVLDVAHVGNQAQDEKDQGSAESDCIVDGLHLELGLHPLHASVLAHRQEVLFVVFRKEPIFLVLSLTLAS